MRTSIAVTMLALLAGVSISEAAAPKTSATAKQQQTTTTSSQPPAGQQGPAPSNFKAPHHRNKFSG